MVTPANGPVKGRSRTLVASSDPSDYAESPHCQKSLVPFLKWLMSRHKKLGGVTEIRAIVDRPVKATYSGYFDPEHIEELVQLILPDPGGPRDKIPYGGTPLIGEAQFYFTMQPANPALLARSAYEFTRAKNTTSDSDIIAYHLFAVDVDPERPAGISSTEQEKKEARKVAREVGSWFHKREIEYLWADSGNGYHLLIPTVAYKEVPRASENAHALLQLLKKEFGTEKVSIDTSIYNPGRILKLYGTKAVKGSDLPDRPHRYAGINMEFIPADIDLFGVLKGELDAFRAETAPKETKPTPGKGTPKKAGSPRPGDGWDFDTSCKVVEGVLKRAGLENRPKDKGGDRIFNFLDCPHHTDPDGQHYECAVIVRSDGSFAAKCMHDEDAGWKEHFKPKVGWDEHIGAVLDDLGIERKSRIRQSHLYQATPGGIVQEKNSKDGKVEVPLTNFTAKVVGDVVEDDGVETRHTFEIEAQLHGRTRRFTLPSQEFNTMNWPVEQLGAEAVVYAGQGNKDHARVAIQLLSGTIPTQTVYTHLGWRKHGDE